MFEDYINIGINGLADSIPNEKIHAVSIKLKLNDDRELSVPLKPHFFSSKMRSVSIISEMDNTSTIHDIKTNTDKKILTERALKNNEVLGIKDLRLITDGKKNNIKLEKVIVKIRNIFDGDEDMKNIPCEECPNIDIVSM